MGISSKFGHTWSWLKTSKEEIRFWFVSYISIFVKKKLDSSVSSCDKVDKNNNDTM